MYQLKGLKPKNKGQTNFYECCDLTEKVYLAHTNVLIHTYSGPVVRLEFLNSCLINYLGTRNNNISDFGGPHILIIIQAIIYSLKMQDIYMDRSYTKLNRSNICIMGAAMATFLGSSSMYIHVSKMGTGPS